MADLNKVILIGRLTKKPELRYTQGGTAVTTLTLAVNRKFSNQNGNNGQQNVDFIDVVVWQKLAELCNQYLDKGRLVAIEGRLQVRTYQANDGSKRRVYEVVANNVQFLDRGNTTQGYTEDVPYSPDKVMSDTVNDTFGDDSFLNDDSNFDDDIPF